MANQNLSIDELFLRGLGGYAEVPPSDVWTALEQRLDNKTKKRPFGWWWVMLLLLATSTGAYFGKDLVNLYAHHTATTSANTISSANNPTTTLSTTTTAPATTTTPDKNTSSAPINPVNNTTKTTTNAIAEKENATVVKKSSTIKNKPIQTVSENKQASIEIENNHEQKTNTTSITNPDKNDNRIAVNTPTKKKKQHITNDTLLNSQIVATKKEPEHLATIKHVTPAIKKDGSIPNKYSSSISETKKKTNQLIDTNNTQRQNTTSNASKRKDDKPVVHKTSLIPKLNNTQQAQLNNSTAITPPDAQQTVTTPPIKMAATEEKKPVVTDTTSIKTLAKTTNTNTSNINSQNSNNNLLTTNKKQTNVTIDKLTVPVTANTNNNKNIVPQAANTVANPSIKKDSTIPGSLTGFHDSAGKVKNPMNYELGLKAAYNVGSKAFSMNGFVISAYLKLSLSDKLALLFQPGLSLNHYGNGPFNSPATYINDPTILPAPTIEGSGGNYFVYHYTQSYDSIIVKHSINGSSSVSFELPVLLSFNVNDKFSVFAGPVFTFGSVPTLSTQPDPHHVGPITRADTFLSALIESQDHYYNNYHTDPKYSTYDSSQYQNPSNNPVRLGLMIGMNYFVDEKLQVNFSLSSNISGLGFIPNDNIESLYSQTYIRIGIGYSLYASNKRKLKK